MTKMPPMTTVIPVGASRMWLATRCLAWAGALLGAALSILLLSAVGAQAHVIVDSAEPQEDGATVVRLSFDHACANAPTVKLATTMPSGARILAIDQPAGWDGEFSATEVRWEGSPIATGITATFEVTARLGGRVGQPLLFPTVQTCADGDSYAWSDPDEGAAEPAPRLIATAAILDPALTVAESAPVATGGATASQVVVAIIATAAAVAGLTWWTRRREAGQR